MAQHLGVVCIIVLWMFTPVPYMPLVSEPGACSFCGRLWADIFPRVFPIYPSISSPPSPQQHQSCSHILSKQTEVKPLSSLKFLWPRHSPAFPHRQATGKNHLKMLLFSFLFSLSCLTQRIHGCTHFMGLPPPKGPPLALQQEFYMEKTVAEVL